LPPLSAICPKNAVYTVTNQSSIPWSTSGVLHGLSREEASSRALDYLKKVGLADKADERLVNLSGASATKGPVGVTILHEPSLMILDEPTEALDPVNSLYLWTLSMNDALRSYSKLVTHRMEEVEQLCDRILLLKDGSSALYGTIDEVKDSFGSQLIALNYGGKLPSMITVYNIKEITTLC